MLRWGPNASSGSSSDAASADRLWLRTACFRMNAAHHLMRVGHVDVLVGVPTLNNAALFVPSSEPFTRPSRATPRDRSLLIQSEGGSGRRDAEYRAKRVC